jgi:hypothetical protein
MTRRIQDWWYFLFYATIRRPEAAGNFPKRVAIGPGRVRWIESEIDAYVDKWIAPRSTVAGTLGSVGHQRNIKKKL